MASRMKTGTTSRLPVTSAPVSIRFTHVRRREIPEARGHPPDLAARSARAVHRQGLSAGLARQPVSRLLGRVQRASQVHAGDDPQDIDWLVYAKTDKYYIKKFEAETNITGYLVMDLSRSMGYTYRQELTKFDYGICLAAALCYLMIHQQDPVGLITFDEKIRQSLPPRSKRTQLGNVLSLLANLQPERRDRHRQEPDADRRHAAASQPGDDVLPTCWPIPSR